MALTIYKSPSQILINLLGSSYIMQTHLYSYIFFAVNKNNITKINCAWAKESDNGVNNI